MKLASGHLSYCTNIHPGESWPDHFEALKRSFPYIKSQVSNDQPMGIGLRLSNAASLELIRDEELVVFKAWLSVNNAYVFTMNGFPYGDFHHAVVKDKVHTPDWTNPERREYTLRLFRILEKLLPPDMDGGISTSPLSYKYWFETEAARAEAKKTATQNILHVVEELIRIKRSRGMLLHLDIEPEPDGLLETGAEFIDWFENDLVPMARQVLVQNLQMTAEQAESSVKEHVCLCYDVCHFAIGFEPHLAIIEELSRKGIRIGKIQISAALKASIPDDLHARARITEAFSKFNEPTYLHQVVMRQKDGSLLRYRDLPDAIAATENALVNEWRAHFHVPVFSEDLGLLQSTQSDIITVLNVQKATPFTNHMEVETYTWEVLPDILKVPLNLSIIRELNWVKNTLS